MGDWTVVAQQTRHQGLHLSEDFIRAASAACTPQDAVKVVFEKSLQCDFNICAVGCLPSNIEGWDEKMLEGTFVVQVDEITDVAAKAKERYDEHRSGHRCLKLYMTDGKAHVCGFEQERIPDLALLMPAGFKIAVKDVPVKRGLMVLTPNNTTVLGGKVDRLEEARRRAVERWMQPVGVLQHPLHTSALTPAAPQRRQCVSDADISQQNSDYDVDVRAACDIGGAGQGNARHSLHRAATAAAWPENSPGVADSQHLGTGSANAPSASTREGASQRAHQMQARQVTRPEAAGMPAGAQADVDTAQAQGPAMQDVLVNRSRASAGHEQRHLNGDHNHVTQNSTAQDEQEGEQGERDGMSFMGGIADADEWDPGQPERYWDAEERLAPPEDEVVELSGEESSDWDMPHAAKPPADQNSWLLASEQAQVVSSGEGGDHAASISSLSQLARTAGVTYPVEISTVAAVTELVSPFRFLDEEKNALDHFCMGVRIEERAGGDDYTASIDPGLLQRLIGMTPAEMHACLVEGQMEVARARIAHLKRLVSTFTGEMLLLINEAQSEPFIRSFVGMEEAGYADLQQKAIVCLRSSRT